MSEEQKKCCVRCRKYKPLDEFHKNPSYAFVRAHYCKECMNLYHREKYVAHPKPKPIVQEWQECPHCGATPQKGCWCIMIYGLSKEMQKRWQR
jgi:hypothetical protein